LGFWNKGLQHYVHAPHCQGSPMHKEIFVLQMKEEAMKKLLLLHIFLVIGWCGVYNTAVSMPDMSCLTYYQIKDSTFVNPDSVLIDTCDKSGKDEYQKLYAKRFFLMRFTNNIIPRDYTTTEDSVIEYSIDDIMHDYQSTTDGFTQLKNIFGDFVFRDYQTQFSDTTTVRQRILKIRFSNYVNIDSVEKYLVSIPLIESARYLRHFGVISEVKERTGMPLISVYPNPAFDFIFINNVDSNDEYNIVNSIGKRIECPQYGDGNRITFMVGSLAPGTYFIRIGDRMVKFLKLPE